MPALMSPSPEKYLFLTLCLWQKSDKQWNCRVLSPHHSHITGERVSETKESALSAMVSGVKTARLLPSKPFTEFQTEGVARFRQWWLEEVQPAPTRLNIPYNMDVFPTSDYQRVFEFSANETHYEIESMFYRTDEERPPLERSRDHFFDLLMEEDT